MSQLQHLTPEQWNVYCLAMNEMSFGSPRDPLVERIAGAYVSGTDANLFGFATYQEIDAHSCYLQLGGIVKHKQGTTASWREYFKLIKALSEKYEVIRTKIWAKNTPMISMALRAGFQIIGCQISDSNLILELERN